MFFLVLPNHSQVALTQDTATLRTTPTTACPFGSRHSLTTVRPRLGFSFVSFLLFPFGVWELKSCREVKLTSSFISEELSHLNCPGFLFSEPGSVDNWCQSLPGGPNLPPTPPDTDSEPDMTAQWSQTSMPEDQWYTGAAQDHSTYVQTSSSEWDAQTLFSSAQDFSTVDAFHWTNTTHGSVDMGLSPVLSQESQSTRTLNSFSEPELPPGLDLSFTSYEPNWDNAGSMMAQETQALQRPLLGNAFVPSMDDMPLGTQMDDAFAQWPMNLGGCSTQPLFYPQSGQTARHAMRSPPVAAPRTLLPRTEGSIASTAPAFAQSSSQRTSRSYIQGRASSRRSSQSVSNVAFAMHGSPRIEAGQYHFHRPATSDVAKTSSMPDAMDPFQTVNPSAQGIRTYAQDSVSAITDPAAEEFTAFIQYDQEEQSAPTVPSRSEKHWILVTAPYTDCL